MSTGGDKTTLYATAGGKLRIKPLHRNIPSTPYDRPHTLIKNTNPSLLKKLVYSGAHKLLNVFRKPLPPLSLQRPSGINDESQNAPHDERRSGSSANTAAATGISDLEQMLQEKNFTRSEIQRLTSLLHSRATESPSDDSLEKHGDARDNFHAAVSTPVVALKIIKEIASPAELAKSYMGSRPTTLALRQDSKLIQRTPITPVAQKAANSLRDLENGFVTPRSRGRSAMYTMARTPYTRSPTYSQKGIRSDYGHGAASTSSRLGHEGKLALNRSSSVLDDVIGSGGSLRRIRQKANVSSQKDKKELGYTIFQQDGSSQNLLLPNETEPKVSGYASVPAKSTQTANKILRHLEKPIPKEKNEKYSVPSHAGTREKSTNKLTLDMLHGQALRSLEKVDGPKFLPSPNDMQKPEAQHHARLHESTSEDNGSRKFPVPNNMLSSINDDSTGSLKGKAPVVGFTDLLSKVQEEPPQKKRAFQMSAPENPVKIDDDIRDNGHVSFPLVQNNKPASSVADITKTPPPPEVFKTHTLVENNNPVLPEVAKNPGQAEVKEAENATSFLGGSVREQDLGFKIPTSSPSSATIHSSVLPQSTLQSEKVAPEKDLSSFSFAKTAENATPVPFSAHKTSELESNSSSDPKANYAISVNGNENDQKSTDINGRSVSSLPAVPTSCFLFGTATKNISAPNITPASNPTDFSTVASRPAPASTSPSISTATTAVSTATTASTAMFTTATTTAAIFSTSSPPPVFNFGSTSSTAPTSMAEAGNTGNTSPFAITSFATVTATAATTTGSGLSSFSSPAATLTTTSQSQGSFFNITNGSQTNTQASSSGTLFGSSAPAFGSSPSFGIGSLGPSSETKFGNSTSGSTTSIFGSTWQQPQISSGSNSTFSSPSSSVFTFGASPTLTPSFMTGGPTSTNSSFAGSPVFGAAAISPNNNYSNIDQMRMEDSMAEDSMQTNSPVSQFGEAPVSAPGFMFDSTTPTPSQTVVPFQFGGQSNQALPPQNPFQSSSFNAGGDSFNAGGGSFSLGSGGEKSNRRIVRVVKNKNRKR